MGALVFIQHLTHHIIWCVGQEIENWQTKTTTGRGVDYRQELLKESESFQRNYTLNTDPSHHLIPRNKYIYMYLCVGVHFAFILPLNKSAATTTAEVL